MLTRLAIDNFRCFVGFEYRPAPANLILGRNGSGKSSMLDALLFLRQFIIAGKPAEELFLMNQRTRWSGRPDQVFEIEATIDSRSYSYQLVMVPSDDLRKPLVASEQFFWRVSHFSSSSMERFGSIKTVSSNSPTPLSVTAPRCSLSALRKRT